MDENFESISQVSSRSSSSSILAKAAAKRAELICRQRSLKKKREIEDRQIMLQREKEEFDLQIEIEATEAGLQAIEECDDKTSLSLISERQERKLDDKVCGENPWLSSPTLASKVDEVKGSFESAIHHSPSMPTLIPQVNVDQEYRPTLTQEDDGKELDNAVTAKIDEVKSSVESSMHYYSPHMSTLAPQVNLIQEHSQTKIDGNEVNKITPPSFTSPLQDNSPGQFGIHDAKLAASPLQVQTSQMQLGNLTAMLIEQQLKSLLPKRDIKPYNGDPLEYCSFMQAFQHGIESKTTDDTERLYYLEQLTTGEPQRLVKGLLNRRHDGYKEAKQLLAKKFGNKYVVADAFKRKAEMWPDVTRDDQKAWTSFSIFLVQYVNTMDDLDCLKEVDHSGIIKMLVDKVPYGARNQWRVFVDNLEDKDHRIAGIADFVKFIEKQTRIICNPLYGNIESKNKSHSKQTSAGTNPKMAAGRKSDRTKAFATSVNGEVETKDCCLFCDNSSTHILKQCKKFDKLDDKSKSDFVFKHGLCFGCLRKGHTKSKCKKKESCQKCGKIHPTILHDPARDNKHPSGNSSQPQHAKEIKETINTTNCGLTGTEDSTSSSSIIPVVVRSKDSGQSVKTYAYLDDGSNAVFCSNKLKNLLGVKGKKTKLQIQTITSETLTHSQLLKNLEVLDVHEQNVIPLPETYTQESIPASADDVITKKDVDEWAYLQDVYLPEVDIDHHVGILIGNNVPKAMEPWEVINSQDDGPYAVKTLLGWTVHGVKKSKGISVNRVIAKESIEQQFTQMYNLDFSERLSDDQKGHSKEDKQFLEMAANSIQQKDGHYELALPFRHEDTKLPNNLHLAQQRAESLKRKLKKNPEFHREYNKSMEKVLKAGYAEKVPENEIEVESGQVWYVPHHGVYHPQKGKLRVVYDCAATYQGTSLNQELLQGPDLTSSLIGVLLRFRQEPVAMMSDIEGMFYQVKVRREDRDWLRFLWWPEGDIQKPLQEYRMCTHLFGATSSPACANFALQQNAKDNEDKYDSEVINTLVRNFYVDDCLKSTSTEDKAVELARDLSDICSKGGFRLTKWVSNSKSVMESIPIGERAEKARNLAFDEDLPSQKALGLLWHLEPDMFGFMIDIKHKPVSRRGMLSTICSLYDPLGFVSPVILPAKQMLQDLCRAKIGWDDDVTEKIRKKWIEWISSLPELQNLRIPRCLKPVGLHDTEVTSVQLHHFSDASDIGYGTASYLRVVKHDGEVECNLVMSKSRVAPVKKISIPRMELTAATVAVKVDTMLKGELEIPVDKTVFWSDSQTVLKYIRNDKTRHPVFVANRVSVIRDGSNPQQWRYVPTEVNPADHASRGMSVKQFMNRPEWLKGPEFLTHPEKEWPESKDEILDEDLEPSSTTTVNAIETKVQTEEENALKKLIEYYSDWNRLRRAVAWWLRLKKHLLNRVKGDCTQDTTKNYLTVEELDESEVNILKFAQHETFPKQIKKLQDASDRHQDHTYSSQQRGGTALDHLDPVMIDGLLKVGGRLQAARIPEETKHQIILPQRSHVTDLIIYHTHQKINHQGRNHVLAELRRRYWIVKAGVTVKSLLKKCVTCKKVQARLSQQKMANLPVSRLQSESPAFTSTGVDYFGPFNVKHGRIVRKRYGVVFTCLTSRAVHIEIAESLDTSSCINALRRFIARRGQIKELLSDNGTNLVGADIELKGALKEWNQEDLIAFSANHGIKWKFNPPAASHFGGIWERQIRTIRKILQAMLNEQHVRECRDEEQLRTLMCEIEYTINSRPITHVSDDPKDLDAITPNDLLLLRPSSLYSPPPGVFTQKDLYSRKRWRQMQYLADLFWKRWSREYLTDLQKRQRWLHPQRNIQPGDVVLVADNQAPRNSWPLGLVEETYPDKSGLVRSVRVKTKTSVLVRPVAKLCLILENEVKPRSSGERRETQEQNRT